MLEHVFHVRSFAPLDDGSGPLSWQQSDDLWNEQSLKTLKFMQKQI